MCSLHYDVNINSEDGIHNNSETSIRHMNLSEKLTNDILIHESFNQIIVIVKYTPIVIYNLKS